MGDVPAWLQLFLAALVGAATATVGIVRLGFSFNTRLQRIENQDLNQIIESHIQADWHDNRYPMLQTRVFAALDKIEDENKKIGQDIAVLLERDRTAQRLEKIIAALNKAAMIPDGN